MARDVSENQTDHQWENNIFVHLDNLEVGNT